MAKILYPSQQFALQQKIARKSIREYQPKIKEVLQADFNKAARLVEKMGVQQTVNNVEALFESQSINNILRNLYENVGGYTAMRYEKIFDKFKKEESIDFDPLDIADEWLAFMLSYWTAISGTKMYGIENTTETEIARILNYAIRYGQENSLAEREINDMAIKLLKEGKINNSRSLLIARTESHQALSTGAFGATKYAVVPLSKQWIHSEYMSAPRRWHLDLDRMTDPDKGGTRILVNQPFMVNTPNQGVIQMQYAHDAAGGAINNCNCRCCTVYIA